MMQREHTTKANLTYSGYKTKKVFSGSYINILPTSLVLHSDPRCDPNSEHYITTGSWTLPQECDDDPCDPTIEICECDPEVEDCPCNPLIEDCDECDPEGKRR